MESDMTIESVVILVAGAMILLASKLPWERLLGLSEHPEINAANFRSIVVGFASFFICQCAILLLLMAILPTTTKKLVPWQIALGATILVGVLLLCRRLRSQLRKAHETRSTNENND